MERRKVGEVFHFFGKIGVAAIRLTEGSITIGDTVVIQGPTTNLEQTVDTLQIEHASVTNANQGQEVGMKVRERVREKDFVYKVVQPEAPAKPQVAPKPKARAALKPMVKAAPKKKAATKRKAALRRKAATKRKAPVRKASRAKRSTKRRGSRKSRSR